MRSQAHDERVVFPRHNATIKVTAKDVNDGNKTIAKDEVLKHNEQVTVKNAGRQGRKTAASATRPRRRSPTRASTSAMSYERQAAEQRGTRSTISAINKC